MADGRHRLDLFGPFGLVAADGDRIDIRSRKGIALIAMLALSRDGVRTRAWLQDMLWGSRGVSQAQASLRRELSTLRTVLAAAGAGELLRLDGQRVALDLTRLAVDALTKPPEAGLELLEGIDLADAEGFEDWLREQRARFHPDSGGRDASYIAVVGHAAPSPVALVTGTTPALPGKPSIAVLAFTDLTPGGAPDLLGDALADDVSVSLARHSALFVIASASSLTYRDGTVEPADICRQLGVRYLLDGTVRRTGDRVRVTVRLMDGVAGAQVWADRFDGTMADLFALQDAVADGVTGQIDASIEESERQRALARPVETADAWQLFWRANALFRQWGREPMLEAISLAEQVLALEPANAWAASLAAFCHGSAYTSNWAADRDASLAAAKRYYAQAMRQGGDDPVVLGYAAGTLISIGGDMDVAARLIDRGLALQPSSPGTLFWGGWVDLTRGDLERARERFELALRLSPKSAARPFSITGIGVCLLAEGRFAEARTVLEEAAQHIPDYPVALAALCVAAGATGEAEAARGFALRLRDAGGLDPVLTMLHNPDHRRMLMAGLSHAGFEEAA